MIRKIIIAALALACAFTSAEARPRHHIVGVTDMIGCSDPVMKPCGNSTSKYNLKYNRAFRHHPKQLKRLAYRSKGDGFGITHHNTARPRAWCGWQMRQWLGVRNPAGNLARWWAGFGSRAHGPAIGTIVVWRHHVGQIVGRASTGQWIVRSGNDGNRIRTRPRSVSNAIAFRWPS